jgi:hypothetical protein
VLGNLPVKLPTHWQYVIDLPDTPYIQSNVPISDEIIATIRNGLRLQISAVTALKPTWVFKKRIEDYNVAFIDPQATNMDGSPALLIRGIQSAGTCIGVGDDGLSESAIILPHQSATNWRYVDYLRDSVRHESEHIVLWANDRALFYYYVGANDIHPIFPSVVDSIIKT